MSLRRTLALAAVAGVAMSSLAACGSAPTVRSAPAGAPTVIAPVAVTTATTPPMGTAAASTPAAGGTTTAGPKPATPTCVSAVAFGTTPQHRTEDKVEVETVTVSIRPLCAGVKGAGALTAAVNRDADALLASWRKERVATNPGGFAGGFTRTARTKVNAPGLVVVESDTYYNLGGAHGNDVREYETLNTSTGQLVTQRHIVAEVAAKGHGRTALLAALDKAADAAAATHGPTGGEALTFDQVSLWPGRDGLHGTINHGTVYAAAVGTVEFSVPWSTVLRSGADVSFVPNRWGY